ncbi:zinc fingers and homeoboxes protein 1-like isoform X3 [Rhinatrema bivittatum]|uniref:zinc fingers and homeoboxes protein 1-like isoform X3 n=1 Tax=Rhinatrema bivittatum TaxID=194408 RepID=UPI00112E2924|nr:zinc fingers and homeoboxes protein 1-like isoform X3 [Rhinatrema bivittatum]XP_029447751.1 zinc fingers and homeoboxes protein 1-like isoform X3 [Rhinatrema bivittatum]XP_029447752.1 zinc fingers and homeoboxes protein 1-like isoform X3 [Rhinatrema bivittatum]
MHNGQKPAQVQLAIRSRKPPQRWFCGEIRNEDCAEVLTAKKFSGDLAYRQQNFQKALQEYSSCFLLLPSANTAMRRDVQESQARCLLHLGKHEEALGIAQKLEKDHHDGRVFSCAEF